MSRRLAAHKPPKKQTLHNSSGNSVHTRDSKELEVPKRKPRHLKRSIEGYGQCVNRKCGDEGNNPSSSCLRSSELNDNYYRSKKEKENLRHLMETNIFFDSYYPQLQGDFSEDCDGSRKSGSSGGETKNNIVPPEVVSTGDLSETDSRKTYHSLKTVSDDVRKRKVQHISRLIFDSNTYTLNSNDTGQESVNSSNSEKENNSTTEQNNNDLNEERRNKKGEKVKILEEEKKEEEKEEDDDDDDVKILIKSTEESSEALSAVDCFSHLYKRIETLEDILQQTLENSIDQKKCKLSEEFKTVQKPHPSKTKFSTSDISDSINQKTGSFGVSEASNNVDETEEKDMPITDHEIRSIKKRLRTLEKKLKQTKTSANEQRSHKTNELPLANKSSEINNIKMEKNCYCRLYNLVSLKQSECPSSNLSETDYFLPRELLVINTRSELLSEKESTDWNLKKEVKKKIISNCKRIKRKCSSIINSRKSKNSISKMLKKCNGIVTEESADTASFSFSTQINGDKTKKSTAILYVKYPYEHRQKAHPRKKIRKKVMKKGKDLCKKNSMTNFLGQGEGNPKQESIQLQNEMNDTSTSVDCDFSSVSDVDNKNNRSKKSGQKVWSTNPWINGPMSSSTSPYRMPLPYAYCPHPNCNECSQWKKYFYKGSTSKVKSLKKQSPFRNPVEILRRGGKLRIPVLFEEVCKTLKSKKESHKNSNVSMRYVLVEKDPRHPLKTFLKKLAQRQTPDKVDQYLFGVSKCCCDHEKMRPVTENFESELPKGLSYFNLAVLTLVLLLAYHYWRKRNFYKLAAMIDGPKPLPLIGNAMEYLALDHVKILDYLLEITTKYNGLAKIWLGGLLLVHISRPEDMEILLSSNKLIEKNRMYRFFDDVLGQGLLNARGDIWRKHRKIIAPTFHPTILKHFVKIFSEQSKILVKVLEKNADGRIFNVFPYVRNCALDFITETALENHIGAQLRVVAPATRAAERLMNITYNRMFKLWLYSDFIFYRTQQGKEYLRLRDLVKESTEPLLEVKKKEVVEQDQNRNNIKNIKRKSFFRQLVELNENAENFNDKELRDEVVTMIITGYETTAATIGFILVMLGIHQDIQARVYEEVMAMQEFLKGRELEAEDLSRFEYMDRVIKETLRLYPVGPIIFRECTSDVKLTKCTIPKGASVAVVILKTHRDPTIWENPEEFDPDHFLPEKCEKRHPYAYIPFSAGPRNCIGKQYAYLSMRVMLYHLLSNYKVWCDLKNDDIKIKSEVTLKMVGGFKIRLLPRRRANVN